jgi:hypothetical protein
VCYPAKLNQTAIKQMQVLSQDKTVKKLTAKNKKDENE